MAQTGFTPISLYYTATAAATPTAGNLVAGELAINTNDGKLFYKDSAGVVQVIGTKGGVGSSTTTQVLYNSSGLVVGSANLTFNGTTLTAGGLTTTGATSTGTFSATGVATFSAGTVSAPAITTTGDTNTGIFFPAADTIAFTEGGVESMRIDSAARLLVGNTTSNNLPYLGTQFAPGFQNYATSGTGGFYRYSADSDPSVFTFTKSRNATIGSQTIVNNGDNLGYIGFAGSDGTNFITAASIVGMVDGVPGTNDMPGRLLFTTTADGASSPTERMRIDSSGNVGIGTSSPAFKLDVAGNGSIGNVYGTGLTIAQAGNSITYPTDNTLAFNTLSTERMRIDSSGNVGIGVTPSAWSTANSIKALQIPSGALWNFSTNYLYLGQNYYWNGTNRIYINTDGASEYQQNAGTHIWYTAPSGTAGTTATLSERMRIDSSGNLLVGTTSVISGATFFSDSANGTCSSRCTTTTAGHSWTFGHDGNDNFRVLNNSATGVYLTYGGTTWTSLSDERTKTKLIPFKDALEKILSLRAGTGRYLKDEEGVSRSFLIAQDVQKVLPEAVNIQPDKMGSLGLSYTDVIPLLVASIKELKAELDSVKAELQTLKGN
jgi:hypothetical protein